MKKLFTTLLVAMALMVSTAAQAQIKFGLKGGLNVTNMSFDSDVIDQSNQEGFFVGPTVKFTLPIVGLGVDLSALYDQRDAKLNDETVSQRSINVPLNVRYGIGLGSLASVYLAAGPQFGFNVGNKNIDITNDENAGGFKFKDSNFSINLGAGVSLINHIEIGFTYNIACGKTGDASWNTAADAVSPFTKKSARNNSWQISAAYFF